EVSKAFSSFLPRINFQSSYSRVERLPEFTVGAGPFAQRVPFGFKDNYQNNINLSYIICSGGLRLDAYNVAKNMVYVRMMELEKARLELRNRIENAYYGYKLAEASLVIAESSLSRAEKHLEVTREQYNRGMVPHLSVMESELALSQARLSVSEAQRQLELARVALNLAVGFPADMVVKIEGDLEYIPNNFSIDTLMRFAFANRPELKMFKYYFTISSITKNMALKKYLPTLGINLSYTYNKPFYYENEYKSNLTTTLFLSVPFFDGLYNKYDYDKAKIELERLISDERSFRQAVEFEVRASYIELENADSSLAIAKKSLQLAKSAFETAEEQFNRGFISNLEYKDAELQYTQAQFGYIYALYKYLVARANLMKASSLYGVKEEKR
ncbi:MAG: TolC family protein, partial [bacterium]